MGGWQDDVNRANLADVIPGRRVLGHGRAGLLQPGSGYQAGAADSNAGPGNGVTIGDLTNPAPRPIAYQTALNFTVIAGLNPVPLMNQTFAADAVVIAVPNGGTSVFFGYSSAITIASGIQIVANQPVEIASDNTREQWELQRPLEALVALVGGGVLGKYRAPRIVLDLSRYFLVTSVAAQTVACMAFYIPEGQ